MIRSVAVTAAVALVALLSACGESGTLAPVSRASSPGSVAAPATGMYRVRRGDSLYTIAWRYGLDYRDLSRWNGIAEPYTIYPEQLLKVTRPAVLPRMPASSAKSSQSRASVTSSATKKRASTTPAKPAKQKKSSSRKAQTAKAPAAASSSTKSGHAVRAWAWPTKGRVIGNFGKAGGKGIDIAGRRGQAIKAAAPGHVVYSGGGLRGYGRLIIIKHNKRYLSAYAHNERLHVKEGDTVKSGQRIAEMGDSGAKSVRLHFEIRRDGKPVDPTRFLPR